MLKLYRLSESQAEAAALVGLDDIERYTVELQPHGTSVSKCSAHEQGIAVVQAPARPAVDT